MMGELLDIDDPLLPHVRRAALYNVPAHQWLLDSARRWARGEFMRRYAGRDCEMLDDAEVQRLIDKYRVCQVAVYVDTFVESRPMWRGGTDDHTHEDRTFVGLLDGRSSFEYLNLRVAADERIAGLQKIADLFELPDEWKTEKWPDPAVTTRRQSRLSARELMQQMQRMQSIAQGQVLHQGDTITMTQTFTAT